jgi:glycosyltransferase involved in cell wall biosynthesis
MDFIEAMKISIITAVYNRADTVRAAVESLRAQSHSSIEHIVQDGGSNDGTLDVLREVLDERASLVSAPDSGIYDALNQGIARSTGKVVGLLHSDDVFADNHVLEWVADRFRDPSIDAVYGDLQYVSQNDHSRVVRYWRAGAYRSDLLGRGWMPPHPTLFLRRWVLDQWGTYDTRFRIAADYDAILRYFSRGDIRAAYIPEVLVRMRLGGESNRSIGRIFLKTQEDYRALRANDVGGIGTLAMKNLSKLVQFF